MRLGMRLDRRTGQTRSDFLPCFEVKRNAAMTGVNLDAFDLRSLVDTAMPFDDTVGLRVDAGLGHVRRLIRHVEAA